MQSDDISSVLILNKKSLSNHESQLFQAELEKFRPHQNRLLQGTHKQTAMMKELTKAYGDLLQDKRVRSEQTRYESFTRQRNQVMAKYKRVFQAFTGLIEGTMQAQSFYTEMEDTVENLEKNVETFVSNRRSEGAQLLGQIERERSTNNAGQADRERDRLRELMERMSTDPSASPSKSTMSRPPPVSGPSDAHDPFSSKSPPPSNYHPNPAPVNNIATSLHSPGGLNRSFMQQAAVPNTSHADHRPEPARPSGLPSVNDPYNPMVYPFQSSMPPQAAQGVYYPNNAQPAPQAYIQHGQYFPHGYIPPPPPGPPPQTNIGNSDQVHPSGPGGYAHYPPPRQAGGGATQRDQNGHWAGVWK